MENRIRLARGGSEVPLETLRMSQLGEMIQLRVSQCLCLWTISWLGVGGAGPLDTEEKLRPPM